MLHDADFEDVSPVELVALARLAENPETAPPPHLRDDLAAKGLVMTTEDGDHLLTSLGEELLELA